MSISVIQEFAAEISAGQTQTIVPVSGITPGNHLIVMVGLGAQVDSVTSVTDDQSNSYGQDFAQASTASQTGLYVLSTHVGTAPTQITINLGNGQSNGKAVYRIWEVSGLASSSWSDGGGWHYTSSTTTPASLAHTPTTIGELAIGLFVAGAIASFSPQAGYTSMGSFNVSGQPDLAAEYNTSAPSGSQSAQITGAPNQVYLAAIIFYKGAPVTTVTAVPGRATAAAVAPSLSIEKVITPPVGGATAASGSNALITSAANIPAKVLTLSRVAPTTSVNQPVPAKILTLNRVPPVGHTDIPAYPPIPPTPPPPPPPPPDPRDVPATDGPFTYLMYDAMEPLTWEDEDLGYPMLNYFKAIAYNMHEPYAFAVNPGWQLALDVDNVPSWWLDWLAQFVGIPRVGFTLLNSANKRALIKDAPGWQRGTLAAMIAAAKTTLTGNQNVIVYERYNPSTAPADAPYHITFITYQSETPNSTATLNALLSQKPGGIQLTLLSRAGQIWQTLRDHYPPTTQRLWSDVKSNYTDWEHARDVTYY